MFVIFVATVLAGSLGAIHYVIVHIVMGRPFAEIPPPVVVDAGDDAPEATEGDGAGLEDDGAPGDEVAGEPEDPGDARG
jgi:hypothetical protein